jgi:hypothetical protein
MSQKLKFKNIFTNSKEEVKKTLTSLWTGVGVTPFQNNTYKEQIVNVIDNLFAPDNKDEKAEPLVQSMYKWEGLPTENQKDAVALVAPVWQKTFFPFKHQYASWKALLNDKKSIVVTTGTGSGKTECFMMPLIKDLADNFNSDKVEALFLYPLNALMEDQKGRLSEYISNSGQDLKFAVYNGNTKEAKEEGIDIPQMNNELIYRDDIRATPPNILLTNPTMLEYMLLRQADQTILSNSQGALKWIVIDETHTFTGAGAAELALLIRRVLHAFGVSVENVRFATSSATIGDDDDGSTKLKQFIADISGKNTSDIEVVKGQREKSKDQQINYKKLSPRFPLKRNRVNEIQEKLISDDFIKLTDLIPEKDTIVEKLEVLDALCEVNLPAKVHYFFKVLDCGLNVKLTDITKDNTFNLHTVEKIDDNEAADTPLLELCRCKQCGNFVAFGQIESEGNETYRFKRRESENENIFLNEDNADTDHEDQDNTGAGLIAFGIKPDDFDEQDNSAFLGRVSNSVFTITDDTDANLITVKGAKCPYCSDVETDEDQSEDIRRGFQSFRVSSEFISRIIAPRLLDEMISYDNGDLPYKGSQFLSFVDSRQGASRATLKQNTFNETRWVQSRVFNYLTEFEKEGIESVNDIKDEISDKEAALKRKPDNVRLKNSLIDLKEELDSYSKGYKTWNELLDYLLEVPDFELLCKQFIKREDLNEDGSIKDEAKRAYAQVVLFEEFNRRPKSALITETMGFVQSYYPKLDGIDVLPDAVVSFNSSLDGENQISLQDWKDLLKIYLDYTVRSNGSLYFKRENWSDIDIFSSQRFQTKKTPRRPAFPPKFNEKGSQSRFVYLLSALAGWNPDERKQNKEAINKVLDALWYDITRCGLIDIGKQLNGNNWVDEKQKENESTPYRMNIADMALKVLKKGAICPVSNRPIDVTFKDYSPYIKEGSVHKVSTKFDWTQSSYPYIKGVDENGTKVNTEQIEKWVEDCRPELKGLGLWTSISSLICSYPQTFVQAEHTAQVNKELAKEHQQDFKDHKINILACSTTMEMGVDLGDLELVVMNSIPPHPANYKQRAGRSGRNDMNKSCALTFCNSDPIGMRTMRDPMQALITRPTAVPMVDLESSQVVQRHINAFLFKSWIGTLHLMNERIIDFFTDYNFAIDGDGRENTRNVQLHKQQISADAGIGADDGSKYRSFKDYLYDLPNDIRLSLRVIVKGSCFEETEPLQLADNTINAIERVYSELATKFHLIQDEWNDDLTERQKRRLNFKFSSLLGKNLLMHLSTHQFTPNANMPVNIIEFDTKIDSNNWGRSNNPSYELKQALSQYVPGNTVVLDNSCFVVRGVEFTNQFNKQNSFRQIQQCSTCGKTWMDNHGKCSCTPESIKIWPDINGLNYLELIEPVGFTRDINEDYNRIKNNNIFTYVNAQLIGADKWSDSEYHQRLFDFRSSSDDETSQILFYNRGIGFGFCVCKHCGKAVIEQEANDGEDVLLNLPDGFNNETYSDGEIQIPFHYDIRREKSQINRHFGKSGTDYTLKRNMLLGGLMQTDYCEIRLYDNHRSTETNSDILHTLGITVVNVLAKYIGIERNDISFIVLNDSFCIYDTAKGGAGYSKRLNDIQTLYAIFDLALEELNNCIYKEDLVDRSTRQYVNKINIPATVNWLELEKNAREIVPDNIMTTYPNATTAKYRDIINGLSANEEKQYLFVDTNVERWDYKEWKSRVSKIRQSSLDGNKVNLCFYGEITQVPPPVRDLLISLNDWVNLFYCPIQDDLHPVAQIGKQFIFTDDVSQLQMSSHWASDNLYCNNNSETNLNIQTYEIPQPQPGVVKFTLPESTRISSKNLYTRLKEANNDTTSLIDNFKEKCSNNGLKIRYKDEHLKSKLGIIITLQFVKALVSDLGCELSSLIIENEEYYDPRGREYSLTANAINGDERDNIISDLSDVAEIEFNEKGEMPHWRVLEVVCNGYQLNIYPNGGFANGWFFNKSKGVYYRFENTDVTTDINLESTKEIMFDIEVL